MWLWEEASATFTHSVFLTRMPCYTCFITYLLVELLTHANINSLCVVLLKYLTGHSITVFLKKINTVLMLKMKMSTAIS